MHKEKGQASIFLALFISTMILLFAFATNIGMLVHAKINLQNAADAAVYAGAAVQARQLTYAAYINYEMRRALKEFLYLYMVRGSLAQTCFPRGPNGERVSLCPAHPGSERYAFNNEYRVDLKPEGPGPFVPSVCVIFDLSNNYCQMHQVAGIPIIKGSGFFGAVDPIINAVKSAQNTIRIKKELDCQDKSQVNSEFLMNWLLNIDPRYVPLSKDDVSPFPIVNSIDGMGFLPRIALLRARLDNLEEALNMNLVREGYGALDTETLRRLLASDKSTRAPWYFERSVQAFLSARNNLPTEDENNGIFSDITMLEMLPDSGGDVAQNPKLQNPPSVVKFNDIMAPVVVANSIFKTGTDVRGGVGACDQIRAPLKINAFPYGVAKDPRLITYYAVHLQAKVRLLFSPFLGSGGDGKVVLSAYSAAKPFGSRIGFDVGKDPNKYLRSTGILQDGDSLVAFSPEYPNILVSDTDTDTDLGGFASNAHLGYLLFVRDKQGEAAAQHVAGAYAPWEVGYYTVAPNMTTPQNLSQFIGNPKFNEDGQYRLEVPLLPVNRAASNDLTFLRTRIEEYFAGTSFVDGTDDPSFIAFKEGMLKDERFTDLFNFLQSQNLVNTHLIPDPLIADAATRNFVQANGGARFTVTAMTLPQKRQLTSWNTEKTSTSPDIVAAGENELGANIGRNGYSVKFESFKNLHDGGAAGNETPTLFTDPFLRLNLPGIAGARITEDLSKIQH